MTLVLFVGLGAFVFTSFLALALTLLGFLGKVGDQLATYFGQAPGLDIVLFVLVWVPWIAGGITAGWSGVLGAVVGQILASQGWVLAHQALHRHQRPEVGINSYLNQRYGWWRNHLALWVTVPVLPVFFLIRAAQVTLYPLLIGLLGFKVYDHREWINVSRHKFEGLVGHDLMWCLYCDWMTGVYALGAEMLRNVESFWCPIRFYDGKKCANCQIDFPDIAKGWVATDGTMADVVQVLEENTIPDRPWTWFNHRDRLDGSDNS